MISLEQVAALAPAVAWIAGFSALMWLFAHCAVWVYFHDTDTSRRQAPRMYFLVRVGSLLMFVAILSGYLAYQ